MVSFRLSNVSVKVGNKFLLKDIDFDLSGGTFLGILGENGAGKSTLLKVLAGATAADTGEISLLGKPLASYAIADLAKTRAVLPQETDIGFPLEAIEVARLANNYANISTDQEESILHDCLTLFNVEALAHRAYLSLSGGEKQRVQLARVVAQLRFHELRNKIPNKSQQQFLLLDEPIAALDLHQQMRTLRTLKDLAEQGIGILMVVHDINLASLYCDQIVILKNGEVLANGHPSATLTEDTLLSAFNVHLQTSTHPDIARPALVPRLV